MLQEIDKAIVFLSSYLYNKLPRRRVDQLVEFLRIEMKAAFRLHWHPQNPELGTAYRCLKFDESVDPMVARCARKSGIPENEILASLPTDLHVWVDPGLVSYRTGETETVHYLFPDQKVEYTERPIPRSAKSSQLYHDLLSRFTTNFSLSVNKSMANSEGNKVFRHSNAEEQTVLEMLWSRRRMAGLSRNELRLGSVCMLRYRGEYIV